MVLGAVTARTAESKIDPSPLPDPNRFSGHGSDQPTDLMYRLSDPNTNNRRLKPADDRPCPVSASGVKKRDRTSRKYRAFSGGVSKVFFSAQNPPKIKPPRRVVGAGGPMQFWHRFLFWLFPNAVGIWVLISPFCF